jgi:hypothetical protein
VARGDQLRARMQARIANSVHRLTVRYGPERPTALGSTPTAAPPSPLTGLAAPLIINPPALTPDRPSVTMPCLWLDAYIGLSRGGDAALQRRTGWVQNATALARVLLTDGLVDPTDLNGPTVFDAAEFIEFNGRKFRLIATELIGSSFAPADSLHVWLEGSHRQ